MFRIIFSIALCGMLALTANAQEQAKQDKAPQATKMVLDSDGNLKGQVFANVKGQKKPVEAKITLIREGVRVKSVFADEKGNFSLGSVTPGKYSVTGSAASFVGVEPIAVVPAPAATAAPIAQDNSFVLSAPSYGSYAPAASCSSACSSSGGGFYGGGGLLGKRRLLRLGLIGGIVAIAVGGDDDASPDN